ncbi:MAG: hypothetical protein UT86_C0003G0057 [Candidatus Magasanikbacteria bacterium GW2011_GWC2_40_17]|uniref:Photosynthesis system II assembly factor Ycf48/Hcf136-like domain-containing protein n=1 Tax=Candidatus Magasanikbacteria bacterium GW2011_GWA2_42_32 TaxID=1619039 RepID=A0A0G1A7G1_9BACT|nr:MAG: hypothetical protein UT86_C0003G0057 [Candidatus Magasanikbacteria bacterium GW2011_GWC2_40_17]KKS56960.1 MAG: hypothetical protein UV20_C0004G0056 [Candidatus Magasanikbacteria bacterium GW2011_GWA2_42_32]
MRRLSLAENFISMRKFFLFSFFLIATLVLVGVGCVQIGSAPAVTDGGIFKSGDKGATWVSRSQFLTIGGQVLNFSKEAVLSLSFDPQDHAALYATGVNTGLLFSYNGGNGWQKPEQIKAGTVSGVAIDYKNKCWVYMALGNLILKTEDCSRTYVPIYQEGRPEVRLTTVATDNFSSAILYAGNSVGDFLKSTDFGKNWVVLNRFENPIVKMIVNPLNSKIIYLATQEKGLYRSGDGGVSWTDLNQGLKQYGGAYVYHDLILFDPKAEGLLLASQYGLIKTGDAGVSWQALTLLTPPNGADIKVVAVNPQNSNEIYYATASTFYKSVDGGVKWMTSKLPSSRPPTFLLIDSNDPKIMYLGFGQAIKK